MRKNYILALLATGALPLSAFAEIDIPGVATDAGSWDLSGVSNVTTDASGLITVPGAQGGYPACTINNLPAGKYIINGTLTNAKFVVYLGENEVTITDGKFETTAPGNLVIEVKAIDMSASYSFGNVTLALDVDLAAIQSQLQALMPTGTLTAPSDNMEDYDADGIKGTDVIAEYNGLVDHTALDDAIAAVNPAGATPEEQLAAYMTYVNDDVKGQVEAYAAKVDAYENGVLDAEGQYVKYPIATLNLWADTLVANTANHASDLAKINSKAIDNLGWQKKLDNLEETIAGTGHTAALATEIAAAQTAITNALTQIAANWGAKGVQAGKAVYAQVSMTGISTAYDDLDNAYSALLGDEDRYQLQWLPKYQELTNAYINAQQVIKDLYKDEPGQKVRQDSVMEAVTAIYNDAVNNLEVKYGDGKCTDAQYTSDKTKIQDAIAALEARTDDDALRLAAEKAALATATGLITGGLGGDLNNIVINAKAYKVNDLKDLQADLQAEIIALQKKVEDIYASIEVLTETYVNDLQPDIDVLQAKIDAFKAQVNIANQLGLLSSNLESARTKINKDANNQYLLGLDAEYSVDVVDMMSGSYNSLKEAIEQQQGIYDDDYNNVSTTSLDNIKASINGETDSYLTNGLKMAKDFADAYKIALPDLTAADAFVNYIANSNPAFDVRITSTITTKKAGVFKVNGVDQTSYKTLADDYQETAQTIVGNLKEARTFTPQNAFDAIEAVMTAINTNDLAANIPATKLAFMKDVIASDLGNMSNFEELQYADTNLQGQMDDANTYAGYSAITPIYDAAKEALDNVLADYDAAIADATLDDAALIAKIDQINAAAKAVIAKMQAVQDQIDVVVNNWDAYQSVLRLIAQVEAKETDAKDYADENSYKPAQDTWKSLIDAKIAAAQGVAISLNGVETPLADVYDAVKMLAEQDGQTNRDNFAAQINEILNWFAGYENAVQNNEIAHNALLDESASVTALVDDVNKTIEAAEVPIILEDGKNAADVLKGYVDALSALDTDLYNAYKDVACEGQNLDGSEQDPTLMYQYEALRAKINDLNATLSDDYAKALKAYNERFIADNWTVSYRTDLMDTYTQAIINLDDYQKAVESCQSLADDADVEDGVDHQPIYDYAPQIQTLLAQVTAMLDTSWPTKVNGVENANQHKLTDDDLTAFIATANGIIDGIGVEYTNKVIKITDAADLILADKNTEVNTLISNVTTELTNAGCDAESITAAVQGANDALDNAALLAQVPLGGRYVPAYISGVAAAINELDAVEITDDQKTQAAVSTRNNAVAAVQAAINAAKATLNASDLPGAKKTNYYNQLDSAQNSLNTYNNYDVDLDNLQYQLGLINGINVAGIQNSIDQAILDNQANNANKEMLDGEVDTLRDNLDALNDWVEQLLVAVDVPLTTLQAKVTKADNDVNSYYESELLSNGDYVNDLNNEIEGVQDAIDQTYKDAYTLELARLNEELLEANRAYNEAAKRWEEETGNSDYPASEEGLEYTAKIEAQTLALGTAATVTGVPTEAEQQAIVDIQTALLQIQIDLGYLSPADILATLNDAATNAIETINASKDALGNYAAEVYTADYEALAAEVEALQQQWNDNVASVIVQEQVYLNDIAEIVNVKLADLDAQAAAYQADREQNAQKEADSNAAYITLNGQLDAKRQNYNTTVGYTQTYADMLTTNVSGLLTNISNNIEDNQQALDSAKDNYQCVGFSWPYSLSNIQSSINSANTTIWRNVTTNYKGEANQAISNAYAALTNGMNHVGADGFAAAINTLRYKLNKLDIVTNGNATAGEAFVADAKSIIADAEALFQDIINAEYIAGDITGTGDITAADYEALINLLGQLEDPTDFGNPAYDVNGDGSVTMADIAKIIDILMGRDSNAGVMSRMPMVNTNNAVYVVKTGVNNGVTRYAVMLNNTAELFGAQMDVILGEGMEIVTEGLAERTSNNEFYGSTTTSGKHRVILSSITKSTFVGSEGAVVYFDVRGEGSLNLDNVLGVDAQGRMYNINVMQNVTGIESISSDAQNADIYNVGGQKLNRTERGVNIIRTDDGKASKVLKK